MPDLSAAALLLTSPAVLFFLLGAAAALARSDLAFPESVSKTLSLYLMLCIGFKGGIEARAAGFQADFLAAAAIGLALSALMPFAVVFLLRRTTRLDAATVCALGATYGSVSVVTFAAANEYLSALGRTPSGHMAAVLALMEAPAILTALALLRRKTATAEGSGGAVLRDVFLGAASVMLLGSFAVGVVSGQPGHAKLELFVGPLFQGVLALFLLDLGLHAARRLLFAGPRFSPPLLAFAVGFPVVAAALAIQLGRAAGLPLADVTLLAVLAGSASYIAAPAAMRVAAPEADPSVFVTSSLAVTFPFNLVLGIPLYAWAASAL